MKKFTQKFNALSGRSEWVMQDEDYDYHQEVARSSYADMLHDTERNQKYYEAIKKAILCMKEQERPVKVLDIGTGSGLLSMMAVQSGADTVIACEAFEPVAECALKVIKANGYEDRIQVIPKRSTEIRVGLGGDMKERANILVAEVFDTELIGEGALNTFHHALTHLLEHDSIVVPASATVYAQIVQSDKISNFNKLQPIVVNEKNTITHPTEIVSCQGAASVHDIQMAQLQETMFVPLTSPTVVFQFDFEGKIPFDMEGLSIQSIPALTNGSCQIVFMWWELKMDRFGHILLSCAPPWAHPEPHNMQWRDHWMQAVYYLPKSLNVTHGEIVHLFSNYDEYSLWFDVSRSLNVDKPSSPVCSCMMHCNNSRSRIGMLNDVNRNSKYIHILEKYITPSSICLCLGNCSFLSIMAAKLGAKKVFAVEPGPLHSVISAYVNHNNEASKIKVINKQFESLTSSDLDDEKIDILIAEPYFQTMLLPWHSLYYWYLRDSLSPLMSNSAVVIPKTMTLCGMAVEFDDLWKIRSPVFKAEGFDLTSFDQMIQKAISMTDEPVEPHPLWEYNSKALTPTFDLVTFKMADDINKSYEKDGSINFFSNGKCNAVVLWVDFKTDETTITTGVLEPPQPGKQPCWDMYSRQGVFFIQPSVPVVISDHKLNYKVKFVANTGEFDFQFSVQLNT